MDCRDFEERIDRYLDSVLTPSEMASAVEHAGRCQECNGLVTSYQHASALLRTAVADKAAAVDVSGLWKSIEAELDGVEGEALRPERGRESLAARLRRFDPRRRAHDLMIGILGPAPLRAGAFAAAAAGLALLVINGGPMMGDMMGDKVGSKLAAGTAAKKAEPLTMIGHHDADAGRRARHVRIDNLDIAPGKSVATWSKPRTRTQVIWVNGPDDEFGVSNATHPR